MTDRVAIAAVAIAGAAAIFTGVQTWYLRQTVGDVHQQAQDAHQQAQDAHQQALDAHKQLRLQFATSVSFEINTEEEQHYLGIGISNDGPGVAIIRSINFYMDEMPTQDIQAELEKRGMDTSRDSGSAFEDGDTIGPGRTKWTIKYRSKNPKDRDRMAQLIEDHVQVAVEYCDLNGSCERRCSEAKGCPKL